MQRRRFCQVSRETVGCLGEVECCCSHRCRRGKAGKLIATYEETGAAYVHRRVGEPSQDFFLLKQIMAAGALARVVSGGQLDGLIDSPACPIEVHFRS